MRPLLLRLVATGRPTGRYNGGAVGVVVLRAVHFRNVCRPGGRCSSRRATGGALAPASTNALAGDRRSRAAIDPAGFCAFFAALRKLAPVILLANVTDPLAPRGLRPGEVYCAAGALSRPVEFRLLIDRWETGPPGA